jgi:hypothetical protein
MAKAIAYANIVNSAKKLFTFKQLRHAIANLVKTRSTLNFCQETDMPQIP